MKKRMLIAMVFVMGLSAEVAKADFTIGEPINLGFPVNRYSNEQAPSISADGLELYFSDHGLSPLRPGGHGGGDLWVTTRPTKDDPWGVPMNLWPVVNSSDNDEQPCISADGLSLYFGSSRDGGLGSEDLWVTTRQTKDSPWNTPENLGSTVNSRYSEWAPNISTDGLTLYFSDYMNYRPGEYGNWDIYMTTRSTISDPWGVPINLGPNVNSSGRDAAPNISADGLAMFFETSFGGFGSQDIWMSVRKTRDSDWEPSFNLGPNINTSRFDAMPSISFDGSTLYFCSDRPGGFGDVDLWQVSIEPVVDFNRDEVIDLQDIIIMTEHWGEDYSMCDIGPMPWGDGIVDIRDMRILVKYLLKDYPLRAHWKMDEADGDIAYDSIGEYDGKLNGNPLWQSEGGMIDGTLMLCGVDDYVEAPFVLDPSNVPFSVFAWIYGGASGQVIISQQGESGETWLGIDPSGKLMTGLVSPSSGWANPEPLVSESVITDGQWHHVGFVWDGSYRALYVDGIEAAKDKYVQDPLKNANGGLYIGASNDLDPISFFIGFIDDVRIYNVALTTEEIAALAQ